MTLGVASYLGRRSAVTDVSIELSSRLLDASPRGQGYESAG